MNRIRIWRHGRLVDLTEPYAAQYSTSFFFEVASSRNDMNAMRISEDTRTLTMNPSYVRTQFFSASWNSELYNCRQAVAMMDLHTSCAKFRLKQIRFRERAIDFTRKKKKVMGGSRCQSVPCQGVKLAAKSSQPFAPECP